MSETVTIPLTPREFLIRQRVFERYGPTGASPFGNMLLAVVLRGELDVDALRAAVMRVFAENPALCSYFSPADAAPAKLRAEPSSMDSPFVYLDRSGGGEPLKRAVRDAIGHQFDITRPPLLRVTVVRRSPTRHVFVLCANHLLVDGWSMALFLRTMSKYYGASGPAKPSEVADAELRAHLAERAAYLGSPALQQERAELLSWLVPAADCLRRKVEVNFPMPNEVHGLVRFDVDVAERVRKRYGLSAVELHRVLYVLLIHWLTGHTEIALSESSANRPPRSRALYGLLSDDLLVRASISAQDTVEALVAAVARGHATAERLSRVPALSVLTELVGAPTLPRFHFNPFGVSVAALRLRGVQVSHFQTMRAYALTEATLVSFDSRRVFVALATPEIEGRGLADIEHALRRMLAGLDDPHQRIADILCGL